MKKRNKKYNPKKSMGYQRLIVTDLMPFFGEVFVFLQSLKNNNFVYKRNDSNEVQIKKIYVTTFIYNELNNKSMDNVNDIRNFINKMFSFFSTVDKLEYVFTEVEYYKLAQLVNDCYRAGVGMIRRNWAYAVAKACEYMELSFKLGNPAISNFIDAEGMNQELLRIFVKDGYINAQLV
jgi:hypothetical protein